MAYLGASGNISSIQKLDPITFDSVTNSFQMTVGGNLVSIAIPTSLIISVGGVIQEPYVDYTVTGSNLVFSSAPLTGLAFFGIALGKSIDIGVVGDGTVTNAKIGETIAITKGGTGSTTADGALTSLGGGAAGVAVFKSATQATARTQLGLGTAAVLAVGTSANNVVQLDGTGKLPAVDGSQLTGLSTGGSVGCINYFPSTSAPVGYIKANGALLSRTTYAALWTYAQASGNLAATDGVWVDGQFSPGDGSTTFRIPDLRENHIRGWADNRTGGLDDGRGIGTLQLDAMQGHIHPVGTWHRGGGSNPGIQETSAAIFGSPGLGAFEPTGSGGTNTPIADGTNGTPRTGAETRVRNVALLACIKY